MRNRTVEMMPIRRKSLRMGFGVNAAPGFTSGLYATFDKADKTAAKSDGGHTSASSITRMIDRRVLNQTCLVVQNFLVNC